jgi:hypothetical protein
LSGLPSIAALVTLGIQEQTPLSGVLMAIALILSGNPRDPSRDSASFPF